MSFIKCFLLTYPPISIVISFTIGLCFMPFVIHIAKRKHLVVKPNKRTSHEGLVPNIGGLDIFIALSGTYVVGLLFTLSVPLLAAMAVMFLVGFIDDLVDLTPFWKLVGETLAAVFLIVFGQVRIFSLYGLFGIETLAPGWSYVLSLIALWGIVNAFNLIDGVDGLASGLGMLYCLFFGIYFQCVGQQLLAASAYACIGALAIFFIYNVFGHRHKIFMGDSGSLLIGLILTLFVFRFMELNWRGEVPEVLQMTAAPAVAICVMFVPLFDTMRVMLTRIKKKQSPFIADKNHIHHLLLRIGLKHKQITYVLLTVSSIFMALGLVGRNWPIWLLIFTACALGTALIFMLWRVLNHMTNSHN